uniref:Chromophore lyase CpcS/CpeS n=1 Tax=Kumanoa americana TaxID=1196377 RepID=A0A1C9CGJ3_9FLOR|nr:chromophore lyase [Kumanoa americana]AOM67489.1 chromophore lyase [Kumanoa americana]
MKQISFFQLNQGKWITQRTIYKIYTNEIYNYKSEIIINSNNHHHNQRISNYGDNLINTELNLYTQNKFNLNNLQINIEFLQAFNKINFLKKQFSSSKKLFYIHSHDSSYISLKTVANNIISFEKIWFVNSNLRLSISLIEKNNKCIMTSFSSDIRIS